MIKHKHFVFLILFGVGICSSQLSGQNITYPGAQLIRPFSPGGFNTIGNASVSGYGSRFDGNGLPITFEVDGGAAGQKMDVFSIDYPAALGSQFSVVFSFINTTQGIPTSFFGQQINFLNGNPTAQFQSGRQEPTGFALIGAPNVIYALGIGTDVYSLSVRFWLNTQNNILGGNYYPNGIPIPVAPTNPTTPPPSGHSCSCEPIHGAGLHLQHQPVQAAELECLQCGAADRLHCQ